MRPALQVQGPCKYRPAGVGLRRWLPGTVLELRGDVVVVLPWFGPKRPLQVPTRHARGLDDLAAQRLRRSIAGIALGVAAMQQRGGGPALTSDLAEHRDVAGPPPRIVARLGAPGKPAGPRPRGRIVDRRYLAWLRGQPCLCSEGCANKSQAHHAGPRPVGRKSHDWRAVPLCAASHRHLHHAGHLPFLTAQESAQLLLAQQVQHLLRYFATTVRPDVDHWYKLGALADRMPQEERAPHLLVVLDLLTEHLLQLRREGGRL